MSYSETTRGNEIIDASNPRLQEAFNYLGIISERARTVGNASANVYREGSDYPSGSINVHITLIHVTEHSRHLK